MSCNVMQFKVTEDLQGLILSKILFHARFKTMLLNPDLNYLKKYIFIKLRTQMSYPQKHDFSQQVNNLQTV